MDKKTIVGLVAGLIVAAGVTVWAASEALNIVCSTAGSCVFGLQEQASLPESVYTTDEAVGGQRGGSQVFTDGVTLGSDTVNYVSGTITAASGLAQASWRNTTGKPAYVDLVTIRTTAATASTSAYILDVGTTSTATYSYSGVSYVDSDGTLIDGFALASSTPANTVISNIGSGLARRQVVQVANGDYVNIKFTAPELCNEAGAGADCYPATSTLRGFDLDYVIRFSYKP